MEDMTDLEKQFSDLKEMYAITFHCNIFVHLHVVWCTWFKKKTDLKKKSNFEVYNKAKKKISPVSCLPTTLTFSPQSSSFYRHNQ